MAEERMMSMGGLFFGYGMKRSAIALPGASERGLLILRETGIQLDVVKSLVLEHGLAQQALELHSHLPHHPLRCHVLRHAARLDAVQCQRPKPESQHR